MRRILIDANSGQGITPMPGHMYKVLETTYRVSEDMSDTEGDILVLHVDMDRPPVYTPMHLLPGVWAAR